MVQDSLHLRGAVHWYTTMVGEACVVGGEGMPSAGCVARTEMGGWCGVWQAAPPGLHPGGCPNLLPPLRARRSAKSPRCVPCAACCTAMACGRCARPSWRRHAAEMRAVCARRQLCMPACISACVERSQLLHVCWEANPVQPLPTTGCRARRHAGPWPGVSQLTQQQPASRCPASQQQARQRRASGRAQGRRLARQQACSGRPAAS